MSKRTKQGAASAAPTLPNEPDLTVRAVVTVHVLEGGTAHVTMKVDMDGATALVTAARSADRDLQMVGVALRAIVMGALGTERVGPVTDVMVAGSRVGRA